MHKFIKSKIAVGYVILILISVFAVYYIYTQALQLTAPDQYEAESVKKRFLINNTLSLLYKAEGFGQSLSAGRKSDYPQYRNTLQRVQDNMDSLKLMTPDLSQQLRIDSINILLQQKKWNMLRLLEAQNEIQPDSLYKHNIERVIAERDTLTSQENVQQKVIIRHDSVRVGKKPKKFFKRLAEVFSPSHKDSDIIVSTSQQLITDTLTRFYNPADTIASIFKDIQNNVSDQQQEIKLRLIRRSDGLLFYNQAITQKINQLIHDFEQDEMAHTLFKLEQREISLHRTSVILGIIAIAIFLIAVCFLILISRDISLSNKYRKQLELAKKRAEDLLVSREKLMLTITHDIKAPVGSIMGYIELLSGLCESKRQQHYLDNMKSSSMHLLDLVNNLLDFHRLESNKMEINRISFIPDELFNEIAGSFIPLTTQKGLEFNIRIDHSHSTQFIGDPFRIRQIANNLLSNAIKFTETGSVTLAVSLQDKGNGKYLLVFGIRDTGTGIAPKEQDKIFQEFTRLPNALGAPGFGLGLSITSKLVHLLEGTISLESETGKGSYFEVALPLYIASAHSVLIEKSQPIPNIPLHCLIVDDDPIQLELTSALLKQYGISTVTTLQPQLVTDLLQNDAFDLIFTDIQMPGLDGFELVKQIRNLNNELIRNIPVIALTARSDMDEPVFISKGFNARLNKPFSGAELSSLILKLTSEKIEKIGNTNEIPVSDGKTPDFSRMLEFADDDAEASNLILDSFITEMEKNRQAMILFMENAETAEISKLAHKMLPLFTLLGLKQSIDHLQELEKWTAGFTPQFRQITESVIAETLSVIEAARRETGSEM